MSPENSQLHNKILLELLAYNIIKQWRLLLDCMVGQMDHTGGEIQIYLKKAEKG